MAVSKRTRFEVLRRDNYVCRYCRSADNPITVDHVLPVALGGSDDPDNLVAACRDCNAGKSSSGPGDSLIADVADDAIRWAKAMQYGAARLVEEKAERDTRNRAFLKEWGKYDDGLNYLPGDFDGMVAYWHKMGVPWELIDEGIGIAWTAYGVPARASFRYLVGIIRNHVHRMQDEATEYLKRQQDEG